MPSFRLARVENILLQEIGSLIVSGKIKDHRVSTLISISHVEVSSDLAHAKIWVSSLQGEKGSVKAAEGLNSAAGFIQSVIGKKLKTRYTPKLRFIPDQSIEESIQIQNRLREVLPNDTDKQ